MKLYALSVVRNEKDIITYMIEQCLKWADKLIIFDNGSSDGTWETILDYKSSKLIPFKSEKKPYTDGLRAEIFQSFEHEMSNEDWWVIQDSDEFYKTSPRHFISRINKNIHYVASKKIDFRLTKEDLMDYSFTGKFEIDIQNIRYHEPKAWSEPRLIRHRRGMTWNVEEIWPRRMGLVYQEPIIVEHYPHRSPQQLKRRNTDRLQAKSENSIFFKHLTSNEKWDDVIKKRSDLVKLDKEDRLFKKIPKGIEFTQKPLVRIIKKIMHSFGIWK